MDKRKSIRGDGMSHLNLQPSRLLPIDRLRPAGIGLRLRRFRRLEPQLRRDEANARSGGTLPLDRGMGQRLSNFTLPDVISHRPVSLYGFAGKKAAVLVFLGAECPLAELYAPRLAELDREFRARGVAFVGINSNAHDSEAQIADQVRKHGIGFPVLKDAGNVVADSALVERSPEVIVLDGRARICYRGAIDDQYGQGTRKPAATHHYLKDALEAIVAGRPVAVKATAVAGCLLDRVEPKAIKVNTKARIRPAPPEIQAAHEAADGKAPTDLGEVTYASAAAAIIQNKCQSCHRPGQVAPFSLLSYDDARKHAAMIGEVVADRRMPPWHADPRYGHFANDRGLSPRQRATLLAWVEQGAALGNPADLPPAKKFAEGWTIGEPDKVIEIPEPYTVPAQGVVEYVRFRVPTGFTEDRWVQAAEARPGDRSVVHHIIVYVDDHKGGDRPGRRLAHLCGYAPGDMPSVYPDGTAKKVPAGADFVFEIHYTPIGRVHTDRSQVGMVFAKTPVTRQAFTVGIAEDKFLIPAHQDNVAVAVVDDRRPGDAAAQLHAPHAPARQGLSIHLAPSGQACRDPPLGARLRLRLAELLRPGRSRSCCPRERASIAWRTTITRRRTPTTQTRPGPSAGATRPLKK